MTTVQPFNQMDMWQQNDHMARVHKVDVGPPMLDGLTQRHDRRHAMDLDLDHTHEYPLPLLQTPDVEGLLATAREAEEVEEDLPEEDGR